MDGIADSMDMRVDMSLSNFRELVMNRELHAAVHGVTKK